MADLLLSVEELSVGFLSRRGVTKAISDVSFHVEPGEIVCLVGESGSGKTVTSLALMRLVDHMNGRILGGNVAFMNESVVTMSEEELRKLRGKQMSMIFQEPMTAMDPVFTIGHQIIESLVRHEGMSKTTARRRAVTLLERVGIPDPEMRLNQYPHELSGGMRQRAMIAMALACNPRLLIADEPTTALDVTIQAQILDLLRELQTEYNMSILLITHDLGVAAEMSDRVIVMYAGKIVEHASTHDLFRRPHHPYTEGLMKSVPAMEGQRHTQLHSIQGSIPHLSELPSGCRFHPRCPYATPECREHEPSLQRFGQHEVACWHVDKVTQSIQSGDAAGAGELHVVDGDQTMRTLPMGNTPALAPILEVRHVSKFFPVKGGVLGRPVAHVRAVDDISFTIQPGETLGVVGESGCGKSTLGRVILQLQEPTSGQVLFQSENLQNLSGSQLRRVRQEMQVIFQDPYGSLNPRWSVGQIIGEPLRVHGIMNRRERAERVSELLDLVGLRSAATHQHPHEFSGGQRQRIGIARAIAMNPKFIVCDEPVSALDVSVQSQVLNLLMDLQERLGLTYLFIAHGLNVVRHISDRVGVMYLGKMVEVSDADELFLHPLHPYTRALLSVIPLPHPGRKSERIVLQGEIPSPLNPPSGCRFRTRCPMATGKCAEEAPELQLHGSGHWVACHYADEA